MTINSLTPIQERFRCQMSSRQVTFTLKRVMEKLYLQSLDLGADNEDLWT